MTYRKGFAGSLVMYHLVFLRIAESKSFPFSFFHMESIITQLSDQAYWEKLLARRLMKGNYTWHEFNEADTFVAEQQYLAVTKRIAQGEHLGIPQKKLVNKMGTGKKRVVYTFGPDEMRVLRLLSYLLYRYDSQFAPNCYAFRQGFRPQDAIRRVNKTLENRPMWAYKLDIHNYFNSIPIELLMPMLKEMFSDDPLLYRFFEDMLTDQHVIENGKVIEEDYAVSKTKTGS